jgi:hypothetical protein
MYLKRDRYREAGIEAILFERVIDWRLSLEIRELGRRAEGGNGQAAANWAPALRPRWSRCFHWPEGLCSIRVELFRGLQSPELILLRSCMG